eukprot:IDg6412t1
MGDYIGLVPGYALSTLSSIRGGARLPPGWSVAERSSLVMRSEPSDWSSHVDVHHPYIHKELARRVRASEKAVGAVAPWTCRWCHRFHAVGSKRYFYIRHAEHPP